MTKIALTNPWTGRTVENDATALADNFDAYVALIDDETRERVNEMFVAQTTADDEDTRETYRLDAAAQHAMWLTIWVNLVGPDDAGRIILGS